MGVPDDQYLVLLGEIKGELAGIRAQMVSAENASNKRIDDLALSVREQTLSSNRRIDDHQQDTDKRFQHLEKRIDVFEGRVAFSTKKTAITSSGTSAIVLALVEALKALVQ